jgi:HemY protein
MIRFLIRFAILVVLAGLVAWVADRPGALTVDWLGMRIETSVALAAGLLAFLFVILMVTYGLLRRTWHAPGAVTEYFRLRKIRRGYEALSSGIVAVGAGDVANARRHVAMAKRVLARDPLTRLLEVQAAQMAGETDKVQTLFAEMAKSPDTKLLGLRGLFNQARQANDLAKARKYAEEALAHRPGLPWASQAMLLIHSSDRHWPGVSATLDGLRKSRVVDDSTASRKQAVVLTAQALEKEKSNPTEALALATRAHKLDPSLVPAAMVAARLHAGQGHARRASKVIEKTWLLHPHVELARIYGHAKASASPRERLGRIQSLVARSSGEEEGAISVAEAAIEAQSMEVAKAALAPYVDARPRARVCTLMATIADAEGDRGRAREWWARAARAPRDPQWTADGIVSDQWLAVSPVTGELGAFAWKAPVERLAHPADTPMPETSRDAPVIVVEEAETTPAEPSPVIVAEAPPAPATQQKSPEKPREPPPRFPIPDDPGIERGEAGEGAPVDAWARRTTG